MKYGKFIIARSSGSQTWMVDSRCFYITEFCEKEKG